jgi:hypothetical protein
LFGNLVNELLPSFKLEDLEAEGADSLPNGHPVNKYSQGATSPLFPEVETLLSLFKSSSKELLELRKQVYLTSLYQLSRNFCVEILIW